MRGVQNGSGNSKGVGGYFSGQKWKFRGGGGPYAKFPPWWGYGCFLELHIVINVHVNDIRILRGFLVKILPCL